MSARGVNSPKRRILVVDDGVVVLELTRRLLEGAAWRMPGLPVVMMSGAADDEYREDARTFGAQTLLAKPLEPEALFRALD